jgi:dTDP-4-amino-4,6-dideoxygalactose transaminase
VIRIPSFRPALGALELDAVRDVFDRRWLSVGQVTETFEREVAATLGARHVIGTASGTAALHLALDVLDLSAGDEVIVPSLTFVAAVQMILAAGATPVFCDVDPRTLCADPDDVARRISPRTRVLLPVHYGGYAADLNALLVLARQHDALVVDDAAHAFGSSHRGRLIGSLGDLTCFSFSPVKNITCGEGGAIATASDEWAAALRRRRNLGIDASAWSRLEFARPWDYAIDDRGFRAALPNLNAAIGLAQLARAGEFRRRKQDVTRRYDAALADIDGLVRLERCVDETFPYSYVVRVPGGRRDTLMTFLRARGIGTSLHYVPNHLQPAFARFRVSLPETERAFAELIVLPLYNDITDAEADEVIEGVRAFFRAG